MKKIYSIKDQMKKRSAAEKTALKKWLRVGHRNGWFKYAAISWSGGPALPAAVAKIRVKVNKYLERKLQEAQEAFLNGRDHKRMEMEYDEVSEALEDEEWWRLIEKGIISQEDLPMGENTEKPWID